MSRVAALVARARTQLGLVALIVLCVVISPVDSQGSLVFLKIDNLLNVLRQVAENGILAVGMTLVVLVGGIDLSVGSVMALSATLAAMLLMERTPQLSSVTAVVVGIGVVATVAWLFGGRRRTRWALALLSGALSGWYLWHQIPRGFSMPAVCLAVIAVGLLLGALTGCVVAKGGLQAFVVTLAMTSVALGLARLFSSGAARDIAFGPGGAAPAFEILRERVVGVPTPAVLFLLTLLAAHVVLTRTRFGRYLYAIGGNEEASVLSGIPVDRVKILVFALCSALAAMTGLIHCAQNMQGNPNDGTSMELDAIAAVVIGGASLMGGKGRVSGTLAGVLMIGALNNIMGLRNVDTNFQLILKGIIIVGAVLLGERSVTPRAFSSRRAGTDRQREPT